MAWDSGCRSSRRTMRRLPDHAAPAILPGPQEGRAASDLRELRPHFGLQSASKFRRRRGQRKSIIETIEGHRMPTKFWKVLASAAAFVVTAAAQSPNGPVTFYKDVLPVLQKNCQSCHRP